MEFFARADGLAGTRTQSTLGWVMIALGVVGLLIGGLLGIQLGVGILVLFAASWARKNPLITLHDDHLDLKPAIAAPRRLIRYQEVSSIEEKSRNKGVLHLADGKKVMLPLAALTDDRRQQLLDTLRRHTAVA